MILDGSLNLNFDRNKPIATAKPSTDKQSSRLKKVNKMKKIYLQGATKQKYNGIINKIWYRYHELTRFTTATGYSSGEEEFEEEVNNLVEWTTGLDEQAI